MWAPRRLGKDTCESVDSVENAGLALVEPVDNLVWFIENGFTCCYYLSTYRGRQIAWSPLKLTV